MRLDPGLRYLNYAVFSALLVSGMIWLAADQFKASEDGEMWQAIAAFALMLHGITAMAALVLLGAMIPIHIERSWRAGKNRMTGFVMVATNVVLVVTASGLYYAGSDLLRSWSADIHIVAGIALPALIVSHIVLGRRARVPGGRPRSLKVGIPGALRPVTFSEDRGSR